jgi:hypothetical protein
MYLVGVEWGTAKPDASELVVLSVTVYCLEMRGHVTQVLRDPASAESQLRVVLVAGRPAARSVTSR